jgi:CheY-like chemotaxis protein
MQERWMTDHVLVKLKGRPGTSLDPDSGLSQLSKLLRISTLMQSRTLAQIEQILNRLQSEEIFDGISDEPSEESPAVSCPIVLVIDDEPFNRKVLCRHLQSCGAQVVAADTVAEAISILGSNHIDLMLIDETLSDGDGRRAWQALQRAAGAKSLPPVGFVFSDPTRVPEPTINETQSRFRLRKPATLEDIRRFVNFRQETPRSSTGLRQIWGEPPT